MKAYNFISKILKKFNLKIDIRSIESGDQKGYSNRPELKVLIWGNTDVSPNTYNLGQPYVMANNFTAHKITNETGYNMRSSHHPEA